MDGKRRRQGGRFATSLGTPSTTDRYVALRLYLDALQGQHRYLPGIPRIGVARNAGCSSI